MRNILDSIVIPKRYRGRTLRPTINPRRTGAIGVETVDVYPGSILRGTIYFDYNVPVSQTFELVAYAGIPGEISSLWSGGMSVTLEGSGSSSVVTTAKDVFDAPSYYGRWLSVDVIAFDLDNNRIDEVNFPDRIHYLSPAPNIGITDIKDWIVS